MGFIGYIKCIFLMCIFVLLSSCFFSKGVVKKTFVRKDVDISYVKKVAVLTFENHTKHETANEIARDITITEILAMDIFDVVGKSFVDAVINEEVGDEEKPIFDKAALKRIARKLHCDGLVIGSVDSYEDKRDGGYTYPVVTLTLRLIDGKTGMVLWQTSGTKTGYTVSERLLGIKPKDINELTFDLIESLLSSLK